MDILGQSYFTNHDPHGEWLYGADMSVHPDYRGRKISTLLYDARKDLVRRLGLRGMVAGGMLPGYNHYRDRMSVAEYASAVVRRRASRPDADAAAAQPASRCAAFCTIISTPASWATTRR